MLPSFRLIAATFFCGFLAVFAGLRMTLSLNDFHDALPVMAAHAAPVTVSSVNDREARRGASSVPMMYDLRFAVSTVTPALVRATPSVFDRPSPPLSIVPSENITAESLATAEPETTVAAFQPDAAIEPQPAAVRTVEGPSVGPLAAIAPQSAPEAELSEPLTAAPESTAAIDQPDQDTAIAPDTGASNTTEAATWPVPTPAAKPQAAKPQAAKPAVAAKAKAVRKKRVRTAQRAPAASSSITNPFGSP
ncbi:MAG: hypothetical protein WCG92_08395 [Hyphomicrobiales bacterium]|nr:hypothetical protein [Alphaproteobacteria bacterium]